MTFFYRSLNEIIDVQNQRHLTPVQKLNELYGYYSTLLTFRDNVQLIPVNLRNNMMNDNIRADNVDRFIQIVRRTYSSNLSNLTSNADRTLIYPNEMRSDSLAEIRERRERLPAFIDEEAHLLSLLGEPRSAVMDAARRMDAWSPTHFTSVHVNAVPPECKFEF